MSEENVEIVRNVIEAFQAGWERGDTAALNSVPVAPDAEWIPAADLVGPASVYRGPEGFIEFMRTWTEEFEEWSSRLKRLVDAGDDRVVALFHQSATGKGSGVPVALDHGAIFELDDGRVIRMRIYRTEAEALEAAGLQE
jgi:ketosteroid isomerase-like protein